MALVLAVVEAIQVHLILVVWLQASGHDPVIVFWHLHHLRLPILIFVLDQEVVKLALGDGPGEVQEVGKGSCHYQLPQEWLLGGLWVLHAGICVTGGLLHNLLGG